MQIIHIPGIAGEHVADCVYRLFMLFDQFGESLFFCVHLHFVYLLDRQLPEKLYGKRNFFQDQSTGPDRRQCFPDRRLRPDKSRPRQPCFMGRGCCRGNNAKSPGGKTAGTLAINTKTVGRPGTVRRNRAKPEARQQRHKKKPFLRGRGQAFGRGPEPTSWPRQREQPRQQPSRKPSNRSSRKRSNHMRRQERQQPLQPSSRWPRLQRRPSNWHCRSS